MCNKKKRRINYNGNTIIIVLSIIAAILSIIAITISIPRTVNVSLSFYNAAISCFSLIIVLLIGWNIYSAYEIRKEAKTLHDEFHKHKILIKNSIRESELETKKNIENTRNGVLMVRGQIEEEFWLYNVNNCVVSEKIIAHALKAINCYSEINDFEHANNCIKGLLYFFKDIIKPSTIKVTNIERGNLYSLLKSIQGQDKLEELQKVYVIISELGEYDELGMRERVTAAAIHLYEIRKDEKNFNGAMKAIENNINEIKLSLKKHGQVDADTKKRIVELSKILINSCFVGKDYKKKLKILESAIKNNDDKIEVEAYAREIIEVMWCNYLMELNLHKKYKQEKSTVL